MSQRQAVVLMIALALGCGVLVALHHGAK